MLKKLKINLDMSKGLAVGPPTTLKYLIANDASSYLLVDGKEEDQVRNNDCGTLIGKAVESCIIGFRDG